MTRPWLLVTAALLLFGCSKAAPPELAPTGGAEPPAAEADPAPSPLPEPAAAPPPAPSEAASAAFAVAAEALKYSRYRMMDRTANVSPEDAQRGLEALATACEGWHPIACRLLGEAWEYSPYPLEGDAASDGQKKAAGYYQRGCDAGDAAACLWLGKMHRFGDGVERDRDRVRELEALGLERLEAACDGAADAVACELVPAYAGGDDAAKRLWRDKALAAYRAGCDAGDASDWVACEGAASMLRTLHADADGQVSAEVQASVDELETRACTLGSTYNHCRPGEW